MKKFLAFCLTLCLTMILGGCVAEISNYFPFGASASASTVPLDGNEYNRYKNQVRYELPPVPAGQYRLYGTVKSGVTCESEGSEKQCYVWNDVPFGMSGDGAGWFYLDIDSATHEVRSVAGHLELTNSKTKSVEVFYLDSIMGFANSSSMPAMPASLSKLFPPANLKFYKLKTKDTKMVIIGSGRQFDAGNYEDDPDNDYWPIGELTLTIPGNIRDLGPGQSISGSATFAKGFPITMPVEISRR